MASPPWPPHSAPSPPSSRRARASRASASRSAAWSGRAAPSASWKASSKGSIRRSSVAARAAAASRASICGAGAPRSASRPRTVVRRFRSPSPSSGRGPRRPWRSSASRARSKAAGGSPSRTKGCLRIASRVTGSAGSTASRATSSARAPLRLAARLSPAEESGTTPQRASLAVTRRARAWSGVTRAAVSSGVSRASRSSRAATVAASSSLRALTSDRPSSPAAIGSTPSLIPSSRSWSMALSQSAVASAGRSASLTSRRRQRPWLEKRAEAGQVATALRFTPARISSRRMAPCGCCSSTLIQASSARLSSRPGSTTQPCGASAMTRSRSAVAGAVPVEPAATSTPCGGLWVQASASRRNSRTRRSDTSTTPSSASRRGQARSAASRKSRDSRQCSARSASTSSASRSPASISSICRLSKKPARASPSSRAAEAEISRPRSRWRWSLTRRVSSNRRFSGSMAVGRSRERSPGSNGGSPSSRSPSGRICGGSTARPSAATTKASASARAPRRVGVSTVACDRASGPSGARAS
jgi:hypothetical protein